MLLNRQQTEHGHAELSETWLCLMGSKIPGIAHILGTLSGLRTSAPLKYGTRDAHNRRVNMVYARISPDMLTSQGPDF